MTSRAGKDEGRPSTSKRSAGCGQAALKPSPTTCGWSCAWRLDEPGQPSAVILDARTVQSTPESGAQAGYNGHKRRKGRKVHLAVDTLGHLLATVITPANEQERAQVAERAALARFRRLARDYACLPETVAGLTFLAFTRLMLDQLIHLP